MRLLHGRRPAAAHTGRRPLNSFIRRQSPRRWLKVLGHASAPADRFIGRVSHGRITVLGIVGLPLLMLATTGHRTGQLRAPAEPRQPTAAGPGE